ncbi:TetR family transcriptional regulator [Mycobacteroides abscessus]|nr:TetR family transcriptional regulator [Mycobacteroides abscessus]SHZ04073.1 TetR family transcriptional regulator [Mycobacteroides abscessus subsp. abscessus]CPS37949.1 TetR family transcriptional regulator [Mycobacteroides abscessus]CPY33663.1 TetR family transcriptional regulator [Mycobacteroides abscessus]CPY44890.1 TetR family transcriptional regulator [Mycobacteroides abscessus]
MARGSRSARSSRRLHRSGRVFGRFAPLSGRDYAGSPVTDRCVKFAGMEDLTLAMTAPRGERADAARNRQHLLNTARELMHEIGAEKVTMDGLAARSGLGKGTVFRRFGSRAGIFQALLDDAERSLQLAVMGGDPPLGPGAPPQERLIAYGHARIQFLLDNHQIARASLDGGQPLPAGPHNALSLTHIRMLLTTIRPQVTDLDILATQLTGALDGPFLLLLHFEGPNENINTAGQRLKTGWTELITQICRIPTPPSR